MLNYTTAIFRMRLKSSVFPRPANNRREGKVDFMENSAAGEQLEMNFDLPSGNRFRHCLEHGVFTVLFEHSAPGPELPDEEAAARLALLEKTALGFTELPCALALTDRYWFDETRRAVDYARLLSETHRNCHVVYLSGRGSDAAAVSGLVAAAGNANLANLVAVSGDRRVNENARALRERPFTESVEILRKLAENPARELFFPGGTVNPHLYSAAGLYGGLFKLVKKFQFGAQFAVTQAGFDMAQLDALLKYLNWRGLCYPVIARLMLLTPEKVEKITSDALPGITISDDFLAILNKELSFSASQFEAAQYRRLELQAAGCRLLGYSGIQISGVETPEKMRIAVERIRQAFREFGTLSHWVDEYKFYLARSDMAPAERHFYLFERLLDTTPGAGERPPEVAEFTLPTPGWRDRLRDGAARFFFPDAARQDPAERHWLKKLLAGCRRCRHCRLPQTQFLCPERCPKRLANGPCGGVRANGWCEAGNFPCVHLAIWLAAERRKECDSLENDFIASGGR